MSAGHAWDQVSFNYEEEIISPLLHAQKNPLFDHLKKLKNKKKLVAADLGCGVGHLLPILQPFKEIYGLDLSHQMLKKAQANLAQQCPHDLGKYFLAKEDFFNLNHYKNKFDVICAINSFLSYHPAKIKAFFEQTVQCLKSKGHFFGIFPSLESIQEEFRYTFEQELKRYRSSKLALKATQRKLDHQRINFAIGIYHTGDMAQKYYTQDELHNYLAQNGFKDVAFDKVVYINELSYNYEDEDVTKHPKMWDWFVHAKKG